MVTQERKREVAPLSPGATALREHGRSLLPMWKAMARREAQWQASDKCPPPHALMQGHEGLLSAPAASVPDSGNLMPKG